MPYSNMTAEQIFMNSYGASYWRNNMELWVECQNIMEVREVICDWFYALRDKTAHSRMPDPRDESVTQEKADKIIQALDDDIMKEKNRFQGLKVEAGPEFFKRLSPSGRLTMAQEILSVMMSDEQIEEEATRRIKNRESLPLNDRLIDYNQQAVSYQDDDPYAVYNRHPSAAEMNALDDEAYYFSLYGAF